MKLKLSVPSVIKSLEATIKTETAKKAEIEKELGKANKQFESSLSTIKKNFNSYKIERIYRYSNTLDIRLVGDCSELVLPEDIERIERQIREQNRIIADLEKNIRVLNMCSDEYVQSSLLTDIMPYL